MEFIFQNSVNHAPSVPYLREIIVFLIASVVLMPLFQRIKVSPVLGYFLVGAVVGPFGLAIVEDVEGVARLAELGVVFLLFTIGLELSWRRLVAMRRLVFGLGGAQVLVTGTAIALAAYGWGNDAEASIIIGFALALSSTAVVSKLLIDRGLFASKVGRAAFGTLLLQDLAVVPLLVLVSVFAARDGNGIAAPVALALVKAAGALLVILVAGRLILRPFYRLVASTRSPELFMALTLLAVLGTAWGTGVSGLSMELGAFLAGLLLSDTEYRPQVESDIEPFKGLLLGLFFISIGMGLDFAMLGALPFEIAYSVIGLVLLKAVLVIGLALLFDLRFADALRTGLLLGTGGEFAFVLVGAAQAGGVVSHDVGQFMLIVAGVSLALTPVLAAGGEWAARRLYEARDGVGDAKAAPFGDLEGHVIIAGFGRVGRMVARLLSNQKISYVALDLDAVRTQSLRAEGHPVFYGDAARSDVLARVGAGRAAAMVITVNDYRAASKAVAGVRARWPNLPVFVRAHDMSHSDELMALGATGIVPDTFESSLQLASDVLCALGASSEAVNAVTDRIRAEGYGEIAAASVLRSRDRTGKST